MNREKVIKGLECHRIDNNHRINCADCPYYVEDDNYIQCVNDLHDDALALLKEQEAVEPKKEDDGTPEHWTMWRYACGDCGQPIDRMDRYCRGCGKQVKWG